MRLRKFNVDKELRKLNFRRNKNKYLKYSLIIISLGVAIVGGLFFSKSKYVHNGIMTPLSTKVAPFVARDYIIAAYIDGEESVNFPSKSDGYVCEHVACDDENVVATWDSNAWGLTTSNISKRTKCTVYFSKPTLHDTILATAGGADYIEAKGVPDFSIAATTDEGMYMALDDYGKSYYYRGAVTNNNVLFANFCWKIIRVNGDGSVRMIYNGVPNNNQCTTQTGEGTSIGISGFNVSETDNASAGYMYGSAGSSTYENTHANINSSAIKQYIDNWYENNLVNYDSYINDTLFCNDRKIADAPAIWEPRDTALGYGGNTTFYKSFNDKSTLVCDNKNDRFTVNDTQKGNGSLRYPISTITVNEILLAGSSYQNNELFYLNSGMFFWTLSPYGFYESYMLVYALYSDGHLAGAGAGYSLGNVRPVINLKETVKISSGDGTMNNPYIVVTE